MGKKENPIALRLGINRTIDSSWYSDRKYAKFLAYDWSMRYYIETLYNNSGTKGNNTIARIFSSFLPFQHTILSTIYNSSLLRKRGAVNNNNKNFGKINNINTSLLLELKKKRNENFQRHLQNNSFSDINKELFHKEWDFLEFTKEKSLIEGSQEKKTFNLNLNISIRLLLLNLLIAETKGYAQKVVQDIEKNEVVNKDLSHHLNDTSLLPLFLNNSNEYLNNNRIKDKNTFKIVNYLEKCAYISSNIYTNIENIRLLKIDQSALLMASFISKQFEMKKTVRQSWILLLHTMNLPLLFKERDTPLLGRQIKGIRLVCSGRFGKVEMARTESWKWGETPLHTFSEKIDYACTTAMTRYGKIGIKVWVCYK